MYLKQIKGYVYNGIELMIMKERNGEEYIVICEEGCNDRLIIEKKGDILHELPREDKPESG